MPRTKKGEGMYPDADPTAPGGMSRKALAAELVQKHGWDKADLKQFEPLNTWSDLIAAVCQERKNREAERPKPGKMDGSSDLDLPEEPDVEAELMARHETATKASRLLNDGVIVVSTDEFDESELDDLMAEFADVEPVPVKVKKETRPPLFLPDPHTKDYRFDGHAGAGPSASERWIHCTASLGASRAFLETLTINQQYQFADANEAARQGTTAHAAAEAEAKVILGESTDEELAATLLELSIVPATEGEAYDDEMAEYITEYTDLIQTYAQERGHDHVKVEQRVSAVIPLMTVDEDGDPEVYEIPGSADMIGYPTKEEPTLVVGDLKYGDGVDVAVEENSQAMIYALGALDLLTDDDGNLITPIEKIVLHIVQPRLGGIKTWELTVDELLDWRDDVLSPALTEALGGKAAGAKFNPGEKACQWCPARGGCAALAAQRVEAAGELFDVIVDAEFNDGPGAFPETGLMRNEDLGRLYQQVLGLTSLAKALKEELNLRLHRGQEVPGFHLVNYSPPRKWKPEAAEELDLGNRDHGVLTEEEAELLWGPRSLVSPTVAEKVLGKEGYAKIAALVNKPDKQPVAAPEGDRRSKWEGKPPEAMFADESGDE